MLLDRNVKGIYLSNKNLKEIPKELFKLKDLRTVELRNNSIEIIPDEIEQLQNLEYLGLENNRIEFISDKIVNLRNLKWLDLTGNDIINVPRILFDLEGMKKIAVKSLPEKSIPIGSLILVDNPIEKPPIEIIARGKESVHNYFKELEEDTLSLQEAKLIIVGEPGAGKTTLAKKIVDIEYPLDSQENSTEGIDVNTNYFVLADNERFRMNIWDFGGQEIYHSTHQFFLTKRSLYVLLSDSRAEDTQFSYWLNAIELLSNNSPLLIVQNEKQDRKKEINESGIRGRFS